MKQTIKISNQSTKRAQACSLPLEGRAGEGGVELGKQIAEALASLFPPLLIEAERVAQTVYQGVHGRRRAGAGETFWQFRRYEQGDAASLIDWRQSSRTDKLFIREREQESAQTACLWSDSSGSMNYSSNKNLPTKTNRARLLMLALANLLLRGGEKIIWLEKNQSIKVQGKKGCEQIASRLTNKQGESTPPNIPLSPNSHIILCSDFLMPAEDLQKTINLYASQNRKGILLHILDPAEIDFPFQGRVELQGCENEPHLTIPNATSLREAYNQKQTAHKTHLTQLAQSAGWLYTNHTTNHQPHTTLLELYQFLTAP